MAIQDARSPSYPQMGLTRCIDLVGKLYEGIHRGSVGNSEAQQIMGFAPKSGSGLAALSALKRFGLIEGRDPQLRVTDLGMKVLEPMNERERTFALREAALRPPLFQEVHDAFGGKLPADSAIRAKLVREKAFTSAGADAFIRSYKDTIGYLAGSKEDSFADDETEADQISGQRDRTPDRGGTEARAQTPSPTPNPQVARPSFGPSDEVLSLRLSPETRVDVLFHGSVSRGNILKLAKLLEVMADSYDE